MKKRIGYVMVVLLFIFLSTFVVVAAEKSDDESTLSEFIIEDGVLVSYEGYDEVVTVPDGVMKIGEGVFRYNDTVKKVILPEGITEIGASAFAGSSIEEINFPQSLEYVDEHAFSGSALKTVTAPECLEFESGRFAFRGCANFGENEGLLIVGNVLVDGSGVNPVDGVLIIPEGITVIATDAFNYEKTGIYKVILPEGIKSIGDGAFFFATNLKEINFPESLTYIGEHSFYHTGFDKVTIPDGVTYIGEDAFLIAGNGSQLTIFGKTGSAAQAYAKENGHSFYPTNMDDFEIVDNVLIKYLGTDAKVTLPDGVTKIEDSAFADNTTVTSVTIPEGVTLIGQKVFQDCVNLSEVNLPDSLTEICYAAFDGCESLERLTLPVGIQGLKNCIFVEANYDILAGTADFNPCYIKELKVEAPNFEILIEPWGLPRWTLCLTELETVYGYDNTDAMTLAEENEATFVPLEENVEDMAVNYSNTLHYNGDVDKDGQVGAEDALAILRHVVNLEALLSLERGEVDGVEGITAVDALQVLRYVVELDAKVVRKPEAFETYQFSANGKFQSLSDEVINQTEVIESKDELTAFMQSVYDQYCTSANEKEFETAKAYFALLDDAYFEENVCVVTVDTGKLGWGRYTVDTLTNLDTYLEGQKIYRRGLVLNYEVGTDTPISSASENSPYILVSSTTIPKEALKGAVLEEVIK